MKIALKPQEKKQLLKDVLSGVIETRHYKRIFNEKGEVDVDFDFPTLQIDDFQEMLDYYYQEKKYTRRYKIVEVKE